MSDRELRTAAALLRFALNPPHYLLDEWDGVKAYATAVFAPLGYSDDEIDTIIGAVYGN